MASRVKFSVFFATLILLLSLFALAAAAWFFLSKPAAVEKVAQVTQHFLPHSSHNSKQAAFKLEDVPPWLFTHVALIALFQLLSVISAAAKASKDVINRRDLAVIQFLIEIPMYLGLFGTLLGVCLTQFLTGALVAPLAYLTTMSGILLHIFGKLTIWLAVAPQAESED